MSNGDGLDMPAMIHKIHQGRFLPSVLAGGAYQLTEDVATNDAGVDGTATAPTFIDHSGAWFPVNQIENCALCHQGSQGSTWNTAPSRTACGACHDLTSFVYPPPPGMTLHPGGNRRPTRRASRPGATAPPISTASQPSTRPRRRIRRRPCSR